MTAEHRLHPLSFLFLVWSQARALVVPALALLVASTSVERWQRVGTVLGLMALAPALLHAVVVQMTTRYRLTGDELVIERGVLSRTRRHVPYARIQHISVRQTPIHRLLGVAEARVETAGGPDPEAHLQVLSLGAIDEMNVHVRRGRGETAHTAPSGDAAPEARPADRTLVALSLADVLVYGAVQNRGWLVVSALLGVAWQLGWMDVGATVGRDTLGGAITSLLTGAYARDPVSMIRPLLTVAGLILLGLLVVRVFSLAWSVSALHGFTLSRRGDDLVIERGLTTRVSLVVPIHRLQMIAIHETPLHRLFGRVEVAALTVTPVVGEEARASAPRWLAPVLPASAVAGLLAEVLPGPLPHPAAWQPVSPRTETRLVRRRLRLVAVLTGLALFAIGPAGLALVLLTPAAWPIARRQARAFGAAATPALVAGRSGWLWRHERYVPIDRVQTLSLVESPFDRRYGMATLVVDTAGYGEEPGILDLPYLGDTDARRLLAAIEARL